MAEKKAGRKGAKRAIAKSDSVEEHEGKPMPLVAEKGDLSIVRGSFYRGPLPPAKEFVEYKRGHEDAPERILRFMDKDQEQKHKVENSLNNYIQTQGVAESRRKDKGQWFSLIIALAIIAAATAVAIYADRGWLPALFGFIALPFLIDRFFERLLTLFAKDKDQKK